MTYLGAILLAFGAIMGSSSRLKVLLLAIAFSLVIISIYALAKQIEFDRFLLFVIIANVALQAGYFLGMLARALHTHKNTRTII